jgi:hypothetical protein
LRTLRRTIARGLASGEPLPDPYPVFGKKRAHVRRGALTLIAGQPGSMKTILTLNMVDQMDVPTLYFSSDSDDFTMASRVLAMKSGETTEVTEEWTRSEVDRAQRILGGFDHVRWSFNSGPSLDHMELIADAYAEVNGEYPHLVVIDIMMDVDYEGAGEQNYWGLMAELKVLARKWMSAVLIVHHSSEGVKGEPCPPRSSIMGKANQLPALILTLAPEDDRLLVAVVKNRFGPQDITGRTFFELKAQPELCRIQSMPAPVDWGKKVEFTL